MSKIFQPQVFWDPSQKKYAVKTPFSDKYVNDLKCLLDHSPRFDGINKIWLVEEDDIETLKKIIAGHFPEHIYGKMDFVPKPDASKKQSQTPAQLNGAQSAALTMFEIGGFETARKVYSMLIKQYHPDISTDPQAHDKAAAITKAWRDLKQQLGWS